MSNRRYQVGDLVRDKMLNEVAIVVEIKRLQRGKAKNVACYKINYTGYTSPLWFSERKGCNWFFGEELELLTKEDHEIERTASIRKRIRRAKRKRRGH